MYRTSSYRREIGMRSGPYTGGAVLLPWRAIDLKTRRKLLHAPPMAAENRRAKTWTMFAIAAICGFALVVASGSGFGQLHHPWLIESRWFIVPFALFLVGIVVPTAWLARRLLSAGAWLPYDRALLPLDAIEHTRRGLLVRPFGDARHAIIEDRVVELQYADGSKFRIRTPSADAMNHAIGWAEGALQRVSLSEDHAEQNLLDPFTDLRDENGFTARAKAKKVDVDAHGARDRSSVVAAIALTLVSIAAAWPLLLLRNRTSDDAAFEYARSQHKVALYEAYLAVASRHAHEVNEVMPRLLLDDAKAHDDAEALDAFLARFPGSPLEREARAALSQACMAIGDNYVYTANHSGTKIFEEVALYASNYPMCATHRAEVSARYFDVLRASLLGNAQMQPELRDVLVDLVTRAERTHDVVPFRIVRGASDGPPNPYDAQWAWDFRTKLGALVPVVDPKLEGPSEIRGGESLVIKGEHVTCRPGERARPDAFVAHFTLWVDGKQRAEWRRRVDDDAQLISAATTSWESSSVCEAVSSP